ncbi:MAG: hypothetical protein IJR59_02190, partial [Firmicutes bacterium]|nr:hypothetical protein [Bacillota bacterium]
GYEGNDSVRTFTRNELTALAKKAGFENIRFYYPYPDYKFPSEIFTDSTVNSGFGAPYSNLNQRSYGLYSEQKMSASLCAEGIMGHFANSFLVELALDKCDDTVDYVKINSLRKEEYRIMTVLSGKNAAYKYPVGDKSSAHIQKMYGQGITYPDGIRSLACERYKGGIKYPYLKYDNLVNIIEKSSGKKPVSTQLKAFFGKFSAQSKNFVNESFKEIFGSFDYASPLECICPANIDLICDNIFVSDGEYIIIDSEWCFDMDIPLQFIIWRSINELYYKNPDIAEKEPINSVFETFVINEEMITAFRHWAVYFAEKYVGLSYFSEYAKPLNQLSLLDVYNENSIKRSVNTSCYYDCGSGYTEEGKYYTDITLDTDGSFRVTFPLPKGAKSVRWDIAEGRLLKCRIDGIESDGEAKFVPDNAEKTEDGFDIFTTSDPHYTITDLSGDSFTLHGKIVNFSLFEAYGAAAENETKFNAELSEKNNEIAEKAKIISDKEISAMLDSRYLQSCESRISAYFAQLMQKQAELDARYSDINNLNAQLEYYRSENIRIQNSLGWRFMSVFWKLKAKLTNRGKGQ